MISSLNEAKELARGTKAAMKAAKILQDAGKRAWAQEGRPGRLKAEAEALKEAARLEDLHIWQMEKTKTTKKGCNTYSYWMAHGEWAIGCATSI